MPVARPQPTGIVGALIAMQTKLFVNGRFVDASARATIPVVNPYDNSVICDIAEARAEDVDAAVEAARHAQKAWARTDPSQRGRILLKLADAIEEEAEDFIRIESMDTGHPVRDARRLDVPRTSACFRYFGGMADKFEGFLPPVYPGYLNYVSREPVGVVGQIVPWNFPLMFTSWKMAPALAAGNTIVIKPSELTPLSTLKIAELMKRVGLPDGVVNVVPGYGHTAGARIADHPDIKKIAFTGSTATGRKIVEASASNLKKVQLELGGKGPNIIFSDADIRAAVERLCVGDLPQSRPGLHRWVEAHPARGDRGRVSRPLPQACPLDPTRQSARRGHRDGTSDLEATPGAGAALCQRRQRGRR